MAHITLSQLTTVLQRIVSWAGGKFAAKNTYSGKLEYADMPVVVLASMGSELDGTSTQRPMSPGSTYFLPAEQGTSARIMFVTLLGQPVNISDPVSGVIYCNAYTDLLYRWDSTTNQMVPVGGTSGGSIDVTGKADLLVAANMLSQSQWPKVVLRNIADTMLDDLTSGDVYFDTGKLYLYRGGNQDTVDLGTPSSKTIFYCLADGKMYRWNGNAFVTALSGYYDNTQSDGRYVRSISVNGQTPQTPNNGNVNLVIEAGAQGQKGEKGDTVVLDPQGLPRFTIVNDLTTGGEADALSAEMGRRLAMLSGTYAEAWAHAQAIPYIFPWLWVETVDGDAICKPIWHRGSGNFVDAAGASVSVEATALPSAPTFSETSGSTVGKGTQLTITPAAGSALYYKIDNGSWIVRDMAVTIEVNATCVITAKCVNNYGSSSEVTCSLTVSGPAVPSFAAAQGTTIGTGNVVSRGGSIVVSVPQGGELHYSTDGTNYTTASGLSVTIPVPATGVHIYAYNVEDGDQSSTIDKSYTMAALAAPSLSPANNTEFPATGGTVTITATNGDSIKYTTDGSDPTSSGSAITVNALTASVNVTSAITIKAIAHDSYGDSTMTSATYSVAVPKLKVTASEATTMNLGETGVDALTINAGVVNEFTPSDLGITSFADHVFPSLSFGDKTKILTFDGGGIQINSLSKAFQSDTNLTSCKGIVLAGTNAKANSVFEECTYLTEVELSGVVNGSMGKAFMVSTQRLTSIDISGLSGNITDCGNMFYGVGATKIDVSQFTFTANKASNMFRNCGHLTTLKVGKIDETGDSNVNLMFMSTKNITTLICTEAEPYTTGWLAEIKNAGGTSSLTHIYVPDNSVSAYQAHSEWGTYASIIQGISNYTE